MSIPIIGEKNPHTAMQDIVIRLLICTTCVTIEELPDHLGRVEDDLLLNLAVQRHRFPDGNEHIGNLMKVPLKFWGNPKVKKSIIDQIKAGSKGLDDISEGFYDTKSTFHEDAMKCYSQHLRPTNGCSEYKADRMRLRNDISVHDRREAGLGSADAGPKVYKCDFCPVKSTVMQKFHKKQGLYK